MISRAPGFGWVFFLFRCSWWSDGKEDACDQDQYARGGGWEGPTCVSECLIFHGDRGWSWGEFDRGAVLPRVFDEVFWITLGDGFAFEFGVVLSSLE